MFEKIGLKFLQTLNPELAHTIALRYLQLKILSLTNMKHQKQYPKLKTKIAGIELQNPVGLAAGFDKNAVAIKPICDLGFGFLEVGAVTPQAQPGNPKPRAFRITEEKAIVNHYGFNNDGMVRVNNRLKKFAKYSVIGLNIGANKNSTDMVNDFNSVLSCCSSNVHFATINISSPNTKRLRDLQSKKKLQRLLETVTYTNQNSPSRIPIFVKISPDLEYRELEHIVKLVQDYKLAGIIATNTSTEYELLRSTEGFVRGGISGKPLFKKSTKVLAQLSTISEGRLPLIGVGGISSGKDAFEKICAGASAVQLYSALTFIGPKLITSILRDLNQIVEERGFSHISEAVGSQKHKYI